MTGNDIARVQAYLRQLLDNQKINVVAPPRKGATVELAVGSEVIGTVHRDEDEGETSFSINIIVLEEDLAPAAATETAAAAKPARSTRR
ncbi:DUF3126 family protein [Acetobacteraceae bacterium KSS8]|uniref:DUF3126 family protein n=1 Tax=Endosaccharibacter trunci TaxID=2812733 RepID=A0ABT1W6D9_9PROT|nr:DUF3126 family protein [Acetobacteraceae bacterium KSS8]